MSLIFHSIKGGNYEHDHAFTGFEIRARTVHLWPLASGRTGRGVDLAATAANPRDTVELPRLPQAPQPCDHRLPALQRSLAVVRRSTLVLRGPAHHRTVFRKPWNLPPVQGQGQAMALAGVKDPNAERLTCKCGRYAIMQWDVPLRWSSKPAGPPLTLDEWDGQLCPWCSAAMDMEQTRLDGYGPRYSDDCLWDDANNDPSEMRHLETTQYERINRGVNDGNQ